MSTALRNRVETSRNLARRTVAGLALAAFAAIAASVFGAPVRAGELAAPRDEVVLTVTGKIANTTDGDKAQFDLAALEALGTVAVDTSTPWTEGVQHFEGVPVRVLLEAVGAGGDTVLATALNNYIAEIPVADFTKYEVILALRQNGEILTIRNKGPIFVVYPYDSDQSLKSEEIYSRSVWQLTALEVQ